MQLNCPRCPGQTTESSTPKARNRTRRRGRCIPLSTARFWSPTAAQSPIPPGHWVLTPSVQPPELSRPLFPTAREILGAAPRAISSAALCSSCLGGAPRLPQDQESQLHVSLTHLMTKKDALPLHKTFQFLRQSVSP